MVRFAFAIRILYENLIRISEDIPRVSSAWAHVHSLNSHQKHNYSHLLRLQRISFKITIRWVIESFFILNTKNNKKSIRANEHKHTYTLVLCIVVRDHKTMMAKFLLVVHSFFSFDQLLFVFSFMIFITIHRECSLSSWLTGCLTVYFRNIPNSQYHSIISNHFTMWTVNSEHTGGHTGWNEYTGKEICKLYTHIYLCAISICTWLKFCAEYTVYCAYLRCV